MIHIISYQHCSHLGAPQAKGLIYPVLREITTVYIVENACKSHVILEQSGDNYFEILESFPRFIKDISFVWLTTSVV